ncbi:MAG TPA: ABC transporter permease [Anaerovoracaceae bacterium]|nr:ABC transporter permease [Anaerovoracaceae bacterium]
MSNKRWSIGDFLQRNMAWVLLAVICIIFGITSDNFFSIANILNILSQNAYIIVAGIGITFLMMSGAMDLSVGYVMSTCGVICATMLSIWNFPVWISIVLTLTLSIAIALLNTFLAIKLKLQILVVSIATMTIFQGVSYLVSHSKSISNFPLVFKFIGQGRILGIPLAIIITAICFVVMSFVLNHTYFGRYVYALGGNEEAAHLAGISVKGMRYAIATITGFFVGLASIMLISRLGAAQSIVGPGTEFSVITGVFLGGVSIRGGEGKLSGVLAGILCISILSNGMQLAGINIYYQYIVKGLIMIIAIGFDVFQLSRRNVIKNQPAVK